SGASPEYSKTELAGVPCKLFVTLIWTNYTIQSELFDPYVFILPTCANKSTGRFERAFVTLGGCLQRLELSNGLRMGLSETKDMAWILNLVTRQGATWANILESVGECLSFPTSGLMQMSFQQCHTLVYCYCLNRNKKQCLLVLSSVVECVWGGRRGDLRSRG
uniref:Uncharacterized protein n=1 Tax=Hucho hucho TaxID=62062 RepID=A0A4W5PCS4_9TELE